MKIQELSFIMGCDKNRVAFTVRHIHTEVNCFEINQLEGTTIDFQIERVEKIVSITIGSLEEFELIDYARWRCTFSRMPNLTQLAMCMEKAITDAQP